MIGEEIIVRDELAGGDSTWVTVVALFNVVFPDIFDVDINVEGLLQLTMIEGGLNIAL